MDKTILITGSSTGIGAATARELGAGNTVFVHYNSSKEAAEGVARDVENSGGKARLVQADLSNEAGCRSLFAEIAKSTEALDVLVNNSGGLIRRHNADELEWSLMEEIFRLNTFSAMMMTTLCLPLLNKGADPSIVNMTSIGMRHGGPTATIYAASKGALDSFTRGIAKELAPAIRVNAIAPGIILTPFHERGSTPEFLKMMQERTPLQRHGTSEQVASAVRFLVESSFITGETIDINGGLFMR